MSRITTKATGMQLLQVAIREHSLRSPMTVEMQHPTFALFLSHALSGTNSVDPQSLSHAWLGIVRAFSVPGGLAAAVMSDRTTLYQLARLTSSEVLPAAVTQSVLISEQVLELSEATRPLVLVTFAVAAAATGFAEGLPSDCAVDKLAARLGSGTSTANSSTDNSEASLPLVEARMTDVSLHGQTQQHHSLSLPQAHTDGHVCMNSLLPSAIILLKLAELMQGNLSVTNAGLGLWIAAAEVSEGISAHSNNISQSTQPHAGLLSEQQDLDDNADVLSEQQCLTAELVQLTLRILKGQGSGQATQGPMACYDMLSSLLRCPDTQEVTLAGMSNPGTTSITQCSYYPQCLACDL